jgi:hypothetical protein
LRERHHGLVHAFEHRPGVDEPVHRHDDEHDVVEVTRVE